MKDQKIMFHCKVQQSLVKEEKSIKDSIVFTSFAGEFKEGMFVDHSKQIESLIVQNNAWDKVTFGEQMDEWILKLSDPRSGETFATIPRCRLNNIIAQRGEEGKVKIGLVIKHQKSPFQQALEMAVSTEVLMHLKLDETVLDGIGDDNEEG